MQMSVPLIYDRAQTMAEVEEEFKRNFPDEYQVMLSPGEPKKVYTLHPRTDWLRAGLWLMAAVLGMMALRMALGW